MAIARDVLRALPIDRPTDAPIETLAYLRGVLVNDAAIRGARARITRVGERAMLTVSTALSPEQRRFAIAHEIGHVEVHRGHSYFGLCTGEQMMDAYANSGHEAEANAFAAEFLMPEHLVAKKCDVKKVSFEPVRAIAAEFQVSLTAGALRFVDLCPERTAIVCSLDRKVEWTWRGPDFGPLRARGSALDTYSLAIDLWEKGRVPTHPETVDAKAWIDVNRRLPEEASLCEHAIAITPERVLSLLWIPSDEEW